MTTRAELRTMVRRWERDQYGSQIFIDEDLDQWMADAIADYSRYFPREQSQTINVVADQRDYSLTSYTGLQELIEVEYPYGQNPPVYVGLRARDDPEGFYGEDFYDVIGMPRPTTLRLAQLPASGQQIGIRYKADHSFPDADSDTLTPPDAHLSLLALFVRWRAISQLESQEIQVPSLALQNAGFMRLSSAKAWSEYKEAVNLALGKKI